MVQKNGYTDARVRYHLSGSEIGIVNLKTQWTGTIKALYKNVLISRITLVPASSCSNWLCSVFYSSPMLVV